MENKKRVLTPNGGFTSELELTTKIAVTGEFENPILSISEFWPQEMFTPNCLLAGRMIGSSEQAIFSRVTGTVERPACLGYLACGRSGKP